MLYIRLEIQRGMLNLAECLLKGNFLKMTLFGSGRLVISF